MKLKYNMIAWCMATGFLSLTACDDDDNWTPGEPAGTVNQVYFEETDQEVVELVRNQTYTYTFTLSRTNGGEAMSVPVQISGASEFEAPETVDFAEGENTAEITVTFKGSEELGYHTCSLSIPDGLYNSPYTSLTSTMDVKLLVANWELMAKDVNFYYSSYIPDFYADLYVTEVSENERLYRFVGFMANYDLTFEVKESKGYSSYTIYPVGGCMGEDNQDWGMDAWFFGKTVADSYKLYPNNDSEHYLDYAYIVTTDDCSYMYFDENWGQITLYYNWYDNAGTHIFAGWEYIYFAWDEPNDSQDE